MKNLRGWRAGRARFAAAAVAACVHAVAFTAEPGSASVEPAALGLGQVVDQARLGSFLYFALASGGVAVVDVSNPKAPQVVGRFAEGQVASRLLVKGDELYLLERREEATTYSLVDPRRPQRQLGRVEPAPLPGPPAPSPAPAPMPGTEVVPAAAHVIEVERGRAIIDGGSRQGFTEGTRVRIVSQRLVPKPDLTGGGTRKVPSGEVTAVLRIEHAEPDRAMAPLGRGDVAAVGDLVTATTEPVSERRWAPRRAPFTARVGFHARPFLGLNATTVTGSSSKPVGILVDAFGAWYAPSLPLAVQVSASPVGFGLGTRETHYPMTFAATGMYTTDYFEIGLGAGALMGNIGPCGPLLDGTEQCEENTGFTVNQSLRLGSLDGLYLAWQMSIFSRPERFVFGVGKAELNLPLTSRLGLFAGGGGGENGWAFGELGVRTAVGGAGARGTMLISASLGYASIFDGPARETVGGPSIAFGMEWRL